MKLRVVKHKRSMSVRVCNMKPINHQPKLCSFQFIFYTRWALFFFLFTENERKKNSNKSSFVVLATHPHALFVYWFFIFAWTLDNECACWCRLSKDYATHATQTQIFTEYLLEYHWVCGEFKSLNVHITISLTATIK